MFAMSAAEFSLYLGIVVIISVLGLAFWTWTQFQDTQRHLKTLEKLIYPLSHGQSNPEPARVEKILPQSTHVDDSDSDNDSETSEAPENLNQTQTENVSEILEAIDNALPQNTHVEDSVEDHVDSVDNIDDTIAAAMDNAAEHLEEEPKETLDSFFPGELTSVDMSNVEDKIDLNSLTRKELAELAETKGIKGFRAMKKHELIEALTA